MPEKKKGTPLQIYQPKRDAPSAQRVVHQPHPPTAPKMKQIVAIGSGKGGVGKSTCSVNLAIALKQLGHRVGLMDADIYGPSVPMMVGAVDYRPAAEGKLAPLAIHGLQVISMGLLVGDERPLIWRGPIASRAVQQFMSDVDWDDLDFLIVDMPPGTGDVQLTICQGIPLSGAVVVTTPQDLAVGVARRGLAMFQKVNVPILGIIENMSRLSCPHCHQPIDLFKKGGGAAAADDLGIPLIGVIPLDPEIVACSDEGLPIALKAPDSLSAIAYRAAAEQLIVQLEARSTTTAPRFAIKETDISDGNLTLVWGDGERIRYPAKPLRLKCPCAACVDEVTGERRITSTMVVDSVKLLGFEAIGRYAIKLHWSDGHSTGLYQLEKLREMALPDH